MSWRKEKSLGPAGIHTLDLPAKSLITILKALQELPFTDQISEVTN
jgi:hypothetical protein